nr:glycosyltransferase family 4 protein [Streptomonospora sp. PA3]
MPTDGGLGAGTPLEVLVVSDVSGRASNAGGVPVAAGALTEALAGLPDANVTLLTAGDTEPHGDARIVSVPRDPDIRWASQQLQEMPPNSAPEDVPGMPSRAEWRPDIVIGHSRFSGPAALAVRKHWYPEAKLCHVVHMPVQRYAEIQGRPKEVQETLVGLERAVLAEADLAVGVGKLLTDVGRAMAAENPRQPAFHELLPGSDVSGPAVRPPLGDTFNILFTGRVNDDIKGYDHLLDVVSELRDRGFDVRLRVRGVPEPYVDAERRRAADRLGEAGVAVILPYTSDLAELAEDYAVSHAAVLPSLIEGFGLVALDAAKAGLVTKSARESGVAELFLDTRVPGAEHIGRSFVVPDLGLDRGARVAVWVEDLIHTIRNYEEDSAAAARLGAELRNNYTWPYAAVGMARAVRNLAHDPHAHTVQGPKGVLLDGDGRRLLPPGAHGAAPGRGFDGVDFPRGLADSPGPQARGAGAAAPKSGARWPPGQQPHRRGR